MRNETVDTTPARHLPELRHVPSKRAWSLSCSCGAYDPQLHPALTDAQTSWQRHYKLVVIPAQRAASCINGHTLDQHGRCALSCDVVRLTAGALG